MANKLISFHNVLDIRTRQQDRPKVAKLIIENGKTFYVVIGTPYGHLHTIQGSVRTWNTYSGAYKGMKRMVSLGD